MFVTLLLATLQENGYSHRNKKFSLDVRAVGSGIIPLNSPSGSTIQQSARRDLLCVAGRTTGLVIILKSMFVFYRLCKIGLRNILRQDPLRSK